jgi:acetyl esterase
MTQSSKPDGLDPEIREFVRQLSASWREHPPLSSVPLSEQRRIADLVRVRWKRGGPVMARTAEHQMPFHGDSVRIRVLNPTDSAPKPALIYLHGGGWTIFSIETHDRIMREYAARAGVVAVAVDFSLSPEVKFPRALEEALEVVRWLQLHGSDLGIDASRLSIGGDSAGAAMSVAVSTMLRDAGQPDVIKAMLLLYGCFDAACDTASYSHYEQGGYLWDRGEMKGLWNNYLRDTRDEMNPLACPIHADVEGLPPAFLLVPECDVMYDECITMGEKMRRAGVLAQTSVYPGTTHNFLEAVSIARVADRAFAESSMWLADMLARQG